MQNEKKLIKIGIADCHGIESYLDKQGNRQNLPILVLRAKVNRQRHAVVYEVEISKEIDEKIEHLIKQGNHKTALQILKKEAGKVKLADGMGNVEKSWELIPNSKLDPWG